MTSTATHVATRVVPDTYCDSLKLLVATGTMAESAGVEWAGALMATPAGLERLADAGVALAEPAGANDLVLAVVADDPATGEAALAAGVEAAFATDKAAEPTDAAASPPRSVADAVDRLGGAEVAIVSVPGDYAALEAHHALTEGLHVLLFSDNVPVQQERELKLRARDLGLLVMGPGAGTAVLDGTGLGFANVVRRGPVGVVAAAGTGAQEVSALLSRWGVGVSQVVGVGGRDLSTAVGGLMVREAIAALDADPSTEAILVVSKPPDAEVAREVLHGEGATPTVCAFLGTDGGVHDRAAATLEQGALRAAALVGAHPRIETAALRAAIASRLPGLPAQRRSVRGYFSGGTLCYEAQVILGEQLGEVYSNEPLDPLFALPAPTGAHVLLDLGAEEYTLGRPHPMIDPSARIGAMSDAADPEVAVVLLDVVLGHGCHDDPAGELAPVCAEIMSDGGPVVVAYVLGTDEDPQGYASQRDRLESVGCLVPETAARAAYAAAALVLRRPEVVEP